MNSCDELDEIAHSYRRMMAAQRLADAQHGATLEQRLWLSRDLRKRFAWNNRDKWLEHDACTAADLLQLLETQPDVVAQLETSLGMPLMHFVAGCSAPFIAVVRHLVEIDGQDVNRLWHRDIAYVVAPLHCVQSLPMLHMLIVGCGADVNAPGALMTPLAYMRKQGSVLLERVLYGYGGSCNHRIWHSGSKPYDSDKLEEDNGDIDLDDDNEISDDDGENGEDKSNEDGENEINENENNENETPLHIACAFGGYTTQTFQRLIPHATTADLDRALWLCCWQQQQWQWGAELPLDCVRCLLAAGANSHALTYDWLVPPLDGKPLPCARAPNADVLFIVLVHQRRQASCASERQQQFARCVALGWPLDASLQRLHARLLSAAHWSAEVEAQQQIIAQCSHS